MTEEQSPYDNSGTADLAQGQINLANSVHDLRMRLSGLEAMVNRLQVQVVQQQDAVESLRIMAQDYVRRGMEGREPQLMRIADALERLAGCVDTRTLGGCGETVTELNVWDGSRFFE